MVQPNQAIQYADLQALATLANQKLQPATPYAFTAFAGTDQIAIATNLKAVASPGMGIFTVGTKVTIWLYSYKTIEGVKTYSYERAELAFYSDNLTQPFLLDFTWDSATDDTAPDGYVAIFPVGSNLTVISGEWEFLWKDIGNATSLSVSDQSFGGANTDGSLVPSAQFSPLFGLMDTPCAHGTWLKTLNTIWHDLMHALDLFGGSLLEFDADTHATSGPWIVSAGPQCYLQIPGAAVSKPVYANLNFLYSDSDSPTGNSLSVEADMPVTGTQWPGASINGVNGANNIKFNQDGTVTGTITFYTTVPGQSATDWNLTASDPSITTSIDPNGNWDNPVSGGPATALIFTFTNTPVRNGVALTLTCTALTGGSLVAEGDAGRVSLVVTATPQAMAKTAATAIHWSGMAANEVALTNVLGDFSLTDTAGAIHNYEAHWRAFCNGVFIANTLPTQGVMPFVDVDLPNYALPGGSFQEGFGNGSRQRVPKNQALASYIPSVDNSPSLWPVLSIDDFEPDSFFGGPYKGSNAWRQFATRTVGSGAFILNPVAVPANSFVAPNFEIITTVAFMQEIRLLVDNANVQLYVKFGTPPTQGDADAILPGGQWNSLTPASPGWIDGAPVFVGFFNPTNEDVEVNAYEIEIDSIAAPNGAFFAAQIADDGTLLPELEGASYTFDDPLSLSTRPIPLFGYSIFEITICRLPGADNSQSVDVDVGIMAGMGWDAAGNFEAIESFTIPAGEDSITEAVFIPVLAGAPLAYQASTGESLIIAAETNFQAMMHSGFALQQEDETVEGITSTFDVGYYDGRPFFNPNYALFFPDQAFTSTLGVVLPLSSALVNDVTDFLNQFA